MSRTQIAPIECLGRVQILGVGITNVDRDAGVRLLSDLIESDCSNARTVYFANAHTLNLACEDAEYCEILNSGDHVFGDGTGVRWATKLQHLRLLANLNGTDMVPLLLEALSGRGYRCFLLGDKPDIVERAASRAQALFPGWEFAGCHHGYFNWGSTPDIVNMINEMRVHLLLVGMGNPLQERWLDHARPQLQVPLSLGTGGLFQYWAGVIDRAPRLYRRLGIEWMHILRRQPHKARRYLLGNPLFLARVLRDQLHRS